MPKAYFTFAKQIFHRRRRFHSFRQERISLKNPPTKSTDFSGGGRWIREPRAKNVPPAHFYGLTAAALFESTFVTKLKLPNRHTAVEEFWWGKVDSNHRSR